MQTPEKPKQKRTVDAIMRDKWLLDQVDRWTPADYAESARLALELHEADK